MNYGVAYSNKVNSQTYSITITKAIERIKKTKYLLVNEISRTIDALFDFRFFSDDSSSTFLIIAYSNSCLIFCKFLLVKQVQDVDKYDICLMLARRNESGSPPPCYMVI